MKRYQLAALIGGTEESLSLLLPDYTHGPFEYSSSSVVEGNLSKTHNPKKSIVFTFHIQFRSKNID